MLTFPNSNLKGKVHGQASLLVRSSKILAGRFYTSDHGRWLNRDPIGVNGGINIYNSVSNNMVNGFSGGLSHSGGMENGGIGNLSSNYGIDPLGLQTFTAHDHSDRYINNGLDNTRKFNKDKSLFSRETNGVWNFEGFEFWLIGTGQTVYLSWSAFDKSGKVKKTLKQLWHTTYRDVMEGIARGIPKKDNVWTKMPSGLTLRHAHVHTGGVSHNSWISLYTAQVVRIDDVEVKRDCIKKTFSYKFDFIFEAWDYADFNPGQSFGPGGLIQDQWIINFHEFTGQGKDYLEQSFIKESWEKLDLQWKLK